MRNLPVAVAVARIGDTFEYRRNSDHEAVCLEIAVSMAVNCGEEGNLKLDRWMLNHTHLIIDFADDIECQIKRDHTKRYGNIERPHWNTGQIFNWKITHTKDAKLVLDLSFHGEAMRGILHDLHWWLLKKTAA